MLQQPQQPVNQSEKIAVKVARSVGGRVDNVFLNPGSTLRDALAAAKQTVDHGMQVRVNGQPVNGLDQPLVQGDVIILMTQIAGGEEG